MSPDRFPGLGNVIPVQKEAFLGVQLSRSLVIHEILLPVFTCCNRQVISSYIFSENSYLVIFYYLSWQIMHSF